MESYYDYCRVLSEFYLACFLLNQNLPKGSLSLLARSNPLDLSSVPPSHPLLCRDEVASGEIAVQAKLPHCFADRFRVYPCGDFGTGVVPREVNPDRQISNLSFFRSPLRLVPREKLIPIVALGRHCLDAVFLHRAAVFPDAEAFHRHLATVCRRVADGGRHAVVRRWRFGRQLFYVGIQTKRLAHRRAYLAGSRTRDHPMQSAG
ncbi:MAG: hypothetical protein ACK5OC_17310 [Pirellula sp.]